MSDDIPATDEAPRAHRVTPEDRAAARRAVLWRVEQGRATRADARDALAALGLLVDVDTRRVAS